MRDHAAHARAGSKGGTPRTLARPRALPPSALGGYSIAQESQESGKRSGESQGARPCHPTFERPGRERKKSAATCIVGKARAPVTQRSAAATQHHPNHTMEALARWGRKWADRYALFAAAAMNGEEGVRRHRQRVARRKRAVRPEALAPPLPPAQLLRRSARCVVCQETLQRGTRAVHLPCCGQPFHRFCLARWWQACCATHPTCPHCGITSLQHRAAQADPRGRARHLGQ